MEQIWSRLLKPLFSMFIRFLIDVICLVKGLYTHVTEGLKNTIHHDYDPKCLMPMIFHLGHTHKATSGHSDHKWRFMVSTVCHIKLLLSLLNTRTWNRKIIQRRYIHQKDFTHKFNLINLQSQSNFKINNYRCILLWRCFLGHKF